MRESPNLGNLTIQSLVKDNVDADRLIKEATEINNGLPASLRATDPEAIDPENLNTLITFGSVTARRLTPDSLGDPIDITSQLKDFAKEAEKAKDLAREALEGTQALEKSIAQRLGTAAGAVAGLPGGDEQGFRLQRAASGEFRDELVSQGENRNIDAATQNKLKDLGRDLLVDFKEVRCAGVVADIVQIAKNDNDPNEGLDSLDQGTVDACAGAQSRN